MIHFLPAAAQFGLADNDDAVHTWELGLCDRERTRQIAYCGLFRRNNDDDDYSDDGCRRLKVILLMVDRVL